MFLRTSSYFPVIALVAGAIAGPAQAEPYAGIALGMTNAEVRLTPSSNWISAEPVLAQMQLGYFFNDYLALEGRYGSSVKRDKDLNIDRLSSLLIKGNIPVSPRLAFYGLAGYSSAKLDKKNLGSQSESDMSFGLGAHYALDKQSAITAEFVNYANGDKTRLSAVQLTIQFKF